MVRLVSQGAKAGLVIAHRVEVAIVSPAHGVVIAIRRCEIAEHSGGQVRSPQPLSAFVRVPGRAIRRGCPGMQSCYVDNHVFHLSSRGNGTSAWAGRKSPFTAR